MEVWEEELVEGILLHKDNVGKYSIFLMIQYFTPDVEVERNMILNVILSLLAVVVEVLVDMVC